MGMILSAGLYDPKGGLAWMLEKGMPIVMDVFDAVLVTAVPPTDRALIEALKEYGCDVGQCRPLGGGYTLHEAVRRGHKLAGRAPTLYMDMDRVLHWALTRPEEMARVVKRAERCDWFVGERTPRAHRSHQRALYETETIANEFVSLALGERKTHDYCVPCLGLSPAAREAFLGARMRRDFSMMTAGLMAIKKAGLNPTYLSADGFDWETPDWHREDVKKAGGVEAYRKSFDTPEEWARRRKIAQDVMRGCRKTTR